MPFIKIFAKIKPIKNPDIQNNLIMPKLYK